MNCDPDVDDGNDEECDVGDDDIRKLTKSKSDKTCSQRRPSDEARSICNDDQ